MQALRKQRTPPGRNRRRPADLEHESDLRLALVVAVGFVVAGAVLAVLLF
ncbi:MAG TPA: hypothetical protein VML75_06865 [Kofleriaceae bacterium]|nr:hypothetical protein [Kofleriaceae bacterium]